MNEIWYQQVNFHLQLFEYDGIDSIDGFKDKKF